jgi:superfamily II DNA or RNA helicase
MGKTFISYLLSNKHKNIIVIAPFRDLLLDILDKYNIYSNNLINNIVISTDGSRDIYDLVMNIKDKNLIGVTYKSIDMLNIFIEYLEDYIIIIDEYHNLNDNLEEVKKILYSDNKILYLSATAPKNDNKEIYGDTKYTYSWKRAIEEGYINDFNIHIPNEEEYEIEYNNIIDIDTIKNDIKIDEKIIKSELDELYPKIYYCIKNIIKNENKKCIIYVSNIDKAIISIMILNILCKMNNYDIDIFMLNYNTSRNKRNEILNKFKNSDKISIILNVHILDEGIDIVECDSILITNESNNMSNIIQRMCRCNRKKNKNSDIYIWDNEKKLEKIIKYLDDNSDNEFSKKIVKRYKYNKGLKKENNNILLLNDIEYNETDKKVIELNDKIIIKDEIIKVDDKKILYNKYQCNICNKIFKQKCHYTYHINKKNKCSINDIRIDGIKIYRCNKCEKIFKCKNNYIYHINKIKSCKENIDNNDNTNIDINDNTNINNNDNTNIDINDNNKQDIYTIINELKNTILEQNNKINILNKKFDNKIDNISKK